MAYKFEDFLRYSNFAIRLAVSPPLSWRTRTTPWNWCTVFKKFWFLLGIFNLIYQNIGMIIYLCIRPNAMKTENNLEKISETGSIMGITLIAIFKMWIFYTYEEKITYLLQQFHNIFPDEHNQIVNFGFHGLGRYRVHYYFSRSNTLLKYATVFYLFAYSFYNSLPLVELIYEYLMPNLEIKYHYQSNTWYLWQFLFEKEPYPKWSFCLAYLCQVHSSLTGVAYIMGGQYLLYFFITQIELHTDCLVNALENLNAKSEQSREHLRILLIYHQHLRRLSKEVNNIFNISFLMNFATSTFAICLMGFSMVSISFAHACKYSVGLLSVLVFTLFICYAGNEYSNVNDRLMPAAFYSNWYDGNARYKRMILLFITNTRKTQELQVYKVTTVSMGTYMVILKLSYRLFAFFQAVSN